jgi:hypothetical protein
MERGLHCSTFSDSSAGKLIGKTSDPEVPKVPFAIWYLEYTNVGTGMGRCPLMLYHHDHATQECDPSPGKCQSASLPDRLTELVVVSL